MIFFDIFIVSIISVFEYSRRTDLLQEEDEQGSFLFLFFWKTKNKWDVANFKLVVNIELAIFWSFGKTFEK